jgi:lysine/ornithine N-monooxygenase
MEHPLIDSVDSLSIDELQGRITDLNKKLAWAMRSNNASLTGQIRMALETFQTKYREKQQALYDAAKKQGQDYSDRIDIS